jgi:hypothetical protein
MIKTKLLSDTLNSVPKKFTKNELAYLSLTGKIELPFRDKWAFILYKKLPRQDFIVSREWTYEQKRIDLAILHNQHKPEPKVLIELTAMYTFDALSKKIRTAYIQKLKNDEKKAKKAKKEVYLVLLMVHPRKQIGEKYEGIVKYRSKINKALKESENSVKKNAIQEINSCFKKAKFHPRYSACDIGKAFGVDIELLYWLIKR